VEKERHIVRKGRFRFQGPVLLLPSVRLFADRIDLSGWNMEGRFRREIPLRKILQVDAPSDSELLIWLCIGEKIHLRVKDAPRWKHEVEVLQRQLKEDPKRSDGKDL